jgi:branched-chain amino acid transport system substrate-binding protein
MVPAARNLIAPEELTNVNGVMDAYLAAERGPEVAAYIKNFKDRFKIDPDPFGSCYYDGAWILKQVLDKVGPDCAKIRDELKAVKDYKGITNASPPTPTATWSIRWPSSDQARHPRTGVHPHDQRL